MSIEKIKNRYKKSKYLKYYIDIIENANFRANNKIDANKILGYSEKHHILPKSLNGGNSKENLTYLSAREHFVCHKLLTKIVTESAEIISMNFALATMARRNKNVDRKLTSRQFEECRTAVSNAMKNREVAYETRVKLSKAAKGQKAWNKGMTYSTEPCSEERRKNISNARKKSSKKLCKHCDRYFDGGNFNQFHGDKCRLNPNIDLDILLKRSEQKRKSTLKSIDKGTFKKTSITKETIECPHCKKRSNNRLSMSRWHFDNCKSLRNP